MLNDMVNYTSGRQRLQALRPDRSRVELLDGARDLRCRRPIPPQGQVIFEIRVASAGDQRQAAPRALPVDKHIPHNAHPAVLGLESRSPPFTGRVVQLDRRSAWIIDDVVDDHPGRMGFEVGISAHVVGIQVADHGDLPAEIVDQGALRVLALFVRRVVQPFSDDAIAEGANVLIVDDLLATGGTISAVVDLVEKIGGKVSALAFVIELDFLNGREKIANYDIKSLIHY